MTHSSTNKSKCIIVNGCSFTNWGPSWSEQINHRVDKFFNHGHKGNCNENIISSTKGAVLRTHQNFDYLAVVVQLTGLERFMLDGVISPTIRTLYDKKSKFNWLGGKINTDGNWRKFRDYYENVFTPELHLKKLFEQIIDLQKTFDEIENVDYRIFQGWNIFHTNEGNMWEEKHKYKNNNIKLLIDEYPGCKELWEKIDLNKFWFFENEFVKYGGMIQWAQYNLDYVDWYKDYAARDFHPSPKAHKEFGKVIATSLVDDMFTNLDKKI